jgi:hypothetical protein
VLSLAQSGRVIGQPAESPEIQAMDQVFLNVLQQNLEKAPEYFMALANSVPAESRARFLSDQGGYRDLIKVVRALPVKPFLKQTLAGTKLNIAKLLFLWHRHYESLAFARLESKPTSNGPRAKPQTAPARISHQDHWSRRRSKRRSGAKSVAVATT